MFNFKIVQDYFQYLSISALNALAAAAGSSASVIPRPAINVNTSTPSNNLRVLVFSPPVTETLNHISISFFTLFKSFSPQVSPASKASLL